MKKEQTLEKLKDIFTGEEMTIYYFNDVIKDILPLSKPKFSNKDIHCDDYKFKFNTIGGFVEAKGYFGNTVIKILDVEITK